MTKMTPKRAGKRSGPESGGLDFLTPREFGERAGLHVSTVRAMVHRGDIPAIRLGAHRMRIPRSFLETAAKAPSRLGPA